MGKIFISHSSKDKDTASDLAHRLQDQGYSDIFLDIHPDGGIRTGENWEEVLYSNLKLCRALIVLCSTDSMASRWCFAEITHARALGKNIFPIKLEECPVFDLLKSHQILRLDQYADKDAAYAVLWGDLVKAGLKEDLPYDPDKPYPGLDAFEAADAGVFFGRETEIEELQFRLEEMHRWREPRLAVVLGASGSGKSSLVRAGVLPRLKRDATRWIVLPPFRPGDQPFDALAQRLVDAFPEKILRRNVPADRASPDTTSPNNASPDTGVPDNASHDKALNGKASPDEDEDERDWVALRDELYRSTAVSEGSRLDEAASLARKESASRSSLADVAVKLKRALEKQRKTEGTAETARGDAVVLLVIDQFEELLKTEQAGTANAFLRLLSAALEGKGPPLMVLATLRSDFFGAFQTHPELQDVRFREWSLGPMPHERLEEVILKPAGKVGITFEEGLVGRMIAETKTDDALPLLAFSLRAMWERCGKVFTTKVFEDELGGVEGAVARMARESVRHVSKGEDEYLLRNAFLRMVRMGGDQFVRRKVLWDRLTLRTRTILKPFIDSHLLVSDGETVEVTHEALFRVWDQLKGWLNEERAFILWRERLGYSLAEWKRNEVLLYGNALAEAENWLGQRDEVLDDDERAFIVQSIAQRERDRQARKARRRRTVYSLVGGLAVVLIVAVVAVSQWLRANDQLNRSTAQRLGVLSQTTLDGSYDLLVDAVLLATESLKRESTSEGFAGWTQGMSLLPVMPVRTIDGGRQGALGNVLSIAFSPDGRLVAVGTGEGLLLLDAHSRALLDTLHASHAYHSVAFSPDGRFLASSHRATEVWDASDWQHLQSLPYVGETLAFSPDGGLLAIVSRGDSTSRLVETDTWTERPLDARDAKQSVAFSPDGKWLALGGTGAAGVSLWGVEDGRLLAESGRPGNTTSVVFLRTLRLLTSNSSGEIQLFRIEREGDSIRLQEQATVNHGGSAGTAGPVLAASSDGEFIVSGSSDYPRGLARLWRMDLGWNLREMGRLGHQAAVEAVAFNPESGEVATAAGSKVYVWPQDPTTPHVASLEHGSSVQGVAFSPDGKWLVAGGTDGMAAVIDAKSWQQIERIDLGEEIRNVIFTPDKRWMALLGSSAVRIYETRTWQAHEMSELPGGIADAFLDPTGTWLLVLGDGLIHPFETDSWKKSPALSGDGLTEIRIAPDAQRLATCTRTFRTIGSGRGMRTVDDLTWRVWDLKTGEAEDSSATLTDRWEPAWPNSAGQISPDGRWQFVKPGWPEVSPEIFYLQDAATGARVAEWRHDDLKVYAFSPESRWLVTAGGDGSIRIWPLWAADMIRMAGERLPRNLSPERFQAYFPGQSYAPSFGHLPIP